MSADVKRKMRLLIIGPHLAKPLEAPKRFNLWADALRSEGYYIVNPVEVAHDIDCDYDIMVMQYFILGHKDIDGVFALRKWEDDTGARALMAIALSINLKILLEAK